MTKSRKSPVEALLTGTPCGPFRMVGNDEDGYDLVDSRVSHVSWIMAGISNAVQARAVANVLNYLESRNV